DLALKRQLDQAGDDVGNVFLPGVRTATCVALSNLELAQLSRADLLEMPRKFGLLRQRVVKQSLARLRSSTVGHRILDEYVAQGLFEGQSMLGLDLENCTRFDACTRGCVAQQGTGPDGIADAGL